MTEPAVAVDRGSDRYTVLVIENTHGVRRDIVRRLSRIDGVVALEAETKAEAIAHLRRHYVDAAIVDIELESQADGFDILIHLGRHCPTAAVVISTQYMRTNQTRMLTSYLGSSRPRIVKALDKNVEPPVDAAAPIEADIERWQANELDLEGSEIVLDLLCDRRDREGFKGVLRESRQELEIELDRVYRQLFGGIPKVADGTPPTIAFKPIEREGLSAAVTVKASVRLGVDKAGKPVDGNECVVKVGPKRDIKEEVRRYHEFVKYGVRLAERVELLATANADGFGAVAYSFAGGVFGEALLTLDELLRLEGGRELADQALARLFKRRENNWYSVECEEAPPVRFVDTSRFDDCYKVLHNGLGNLQGQFPKHGYGLALADEEKDGAFTYPGGKLTIPTVRIKGGHDQISPSRPQCFVHGDMHGGNVMVELSRNGGPDSWTLRRVCLIDYRRAGEGPRAVDAVALQATLRLADAQAIQEEVTGSSDAEPSGEDLAKAVDIASRRSFAEKRVLEEVWGEEPGDEVILPEGPISWETSAALITRLMRMNFKDMSLEEYLATAVPCGVRQFQYGLSPLARVRVLAWVSAMWEALKEQS